MAGRKWTKEEEEYLLKNYKKANRVLAKELNRYIGSVQQKLFRMGLLKPNRWTEEEDNFLVEKWDTMKLESIAKKLGRSKRAVEERAYNTLKLGCRNQWYTLKEVQEMTGISKVAIRKRIVKDNIPHHRGKTKQKPFMFDEVQLKRFLKDYQFLWHHKNLTINLFSDQKWYKDKVEYELKEASNQAKRHKPYSEYEDEVLLNSIKQGLSYEEIGKLINRSETSVRARHRYKYNFLYKR